MSNVRMLVINDFDKATVALTTGAVVATLPATNLQLYNNSRIFRSTSLSIVLAGNFEDIRLISALVLWRHNITAAGTVRLQLYANANQTGAVVYDSGAIGALPQTAFGDWDWRIQPVVSSAFDSWATKYTQLWFDGVFARSYKITIADAVNPDNRIDITRIYMGRHFSPAVNFNYGNPWSFDSKEEPLRTDDGGLFGNATALWRKETFNLDHLNSADRASLIDGIRHVGRSKDWFISLYPEAGGQKEIEHSFACKFTQLPPVTATHFNNWSAPLAVEEC